MPTTVENSIGTSGRTYSTPQTWEDASPASLTADDKIWRGEMYNDAEFTGTLVISGITTDSTRYVELTAAAGHSFQDDASVRSNALYYDQTKGVGIACNTASTTAILNSVNYTRISRIQIKQSAASYALRSNCANGGRFKDIIVRHAGSANFAVMFDGSSSPLIANALILPNAGCDGGLQLYSCSSPKATNVTIAGAGSYDIINQSTSAAVSACAVFGTYSNRWTQTSSLGTCGYNCTDHSSAWGSSNQVSKSAANQFENTSSDFRLKSGSDCIGTGNTDATNAPSDIGGALRLAGTLGDIGAWAFNVGTIPIMLGGSRKNSLRPRMFAPGMAR